MASEFENYLAAKRGLVNEYLHGVLGRQAGVPAPLHEAMGYGLLTPGKRLRPLLVLLAAEASGDESTAALPAAAAVEMIHAYSLIHDDLPAMDDDDWRRGRPTCHKKFGEALAILAGDALQGLAFQVLADGFPARTAAACCLELARAAGAAGMVGGQAEDLAWERPASVVYVDDGETKSEKRAATLADVENIHALKTGALFRACLRLGLLSAQGERSGGPDATLRDRLDAYGRSFGQAFQVTDDLLDVEGSLEQTGKRVQKDAARGKLTYPGFLGVEESRRRASQLCRQAQAELTPLGDAGRRLADLVPFLLDRDR